MKLQGLILAAFAATSVWADGPTTPKVEPVEYSDPYDNNFPLLGHVSLPETIPAPAVVIVVRALVLLAEQAADKMVCPAHFHSVRQMLFVARLEQCG